MRATRSRRRPRAVPPSIGRSTVSNVYSLVTYLWPVWDNRRQTIDDKIVHTLVVQYQPWKSPSQGAARADAAGTPTGGAPW